MYDTHDFTDTYEAQDYLDRVERANCFAVDALLYEESDPDYTAGLFDDTPDWTEQNILESTDPETGAFDWDYFAYLCEIC